MKLHIHHVAIICHDTKTSQAFYENVFGFKTIHTIYRKDKQSWKIDMRVEGVQLELFSFPQSPPRLTQPEARGLRHIAFAVESIKWWHDRCLRMQLAPNTCAPILSQENDSFL